MLKVANMDNQDIKLQIEANMTNWEVFKENSQKALALIDEGKQEEAKEYFNTTERVGAILGDGLSKLMKLNFMDAQARSESNKRLAFSAMNSVVVIGIVGLIIAITLAIALSRIISKPINKMVYTADQIALGNVEADIEVDSKDETGKLG